MDPIEVLQAVLARPGADTSATATRTAEAAASTAPTRLAAEGAALLDTRRKERYERVLIGLGITRDGIDDAKNTNSWQSLIIRMHRAERLGIELETGLERRADRSGTANPQRQNDGLRLLHEYDAYLVREMRCATHHSQPQTILGRTPARRGTELIS